MIIQTIRMKSVTAEGMGTLSVFEAEHDVPFAIKRTTTSTMSPQVSSAAATPTKSCARSSGALTVRSASAWTMAAKKPM